MQRENNNLTDGMKVKRMREILRIKQEYLAVQMGLSQQAVSHLEQRETIDMITLEKVASILKVPVEAIQNFDEEKAIFNIQNMHDSSQAIYQYNFNPVEKIVELYEALVKSEKEKVEILQKLLEERK